MSPPSPRSLRLMSHLLIVLGCLLALAATWHRTPTTDEANHLHMGVQILREGSWARFDNSKMPVSAINALPTLLFGVPDRDPHDWFWPRAPGVLFLAGSALLAAAWARGLLQRAGEPEGRIEIGGLVAAGLVAFDPNLQAHAALVTTDLPCVFFVLGSAWSTWLAAEEGTWRAWVKAGLFLGFAQAVKFTSVFLLPILGLALLVLMLRRRLQGAPSTLGPGRALLSVFAAIFALNLSYGFEGTFVRASELGWRSEMLAPLARAELPLPFPRPWLEGLDWVRADDERGHGNIYADGEISVDGRKDHYLRTLSRKLPLPLLILGPIALFWPRRRPGTESLFLVWPVLFFLGWFSLAFNFQIGTRYLWPIIPLLAVSVARLSPALSLGALAWVIASGLSFFPHGLSYHNERLHLAAPAGLLHARADLWRYLGDSDLDWGQEDLARDRWAREHPQGIVNPDVPAVGPMLLSANTLNGVAGDPIRFACLREKYPPKHSIALIWYEWDLKPQDFRACLPERRYEEGPGELQIESQGQPLVIQARVRGPALLQAGGSEPVRSTLEESDERLIGFVLEASQGRVNLHTEGRVLGIYIDGRPIPGLPVEDR